MKGLLTAFLDVFKKNQVPLNTGVNILNNINLNIVALFYSAHQ